MITLHMIKTVRSPSRMYQTFFKQNLIAIEQTIVKNRPPIYFSHCEHVYRKFSWVSWLSFLSTSTPVLFFQDTLIQLHNISGLPWWSVIMLSTIGLRTCVTLPLAIHQNQVIGRLESLRKEMLTAKEQINKELYDDSRKYNWNLRTSRIMFRKKMKSKYDEIVIRDNCHPAKLVLLIFVQVPMWICFSASLRNICYMRPLQPDSQKIFWQLQSEGALWFSNLTIPDPFLIPIILGSINFIIIELYRLRSIKQVSMFQKILQNVSRGFAVLIAVVAINTPSCISFYWLCSSSFGFAQNILLLMPKIRRILRIPKTSFESATPFTDMWKNLMSILKRKKES